MLNGLGNAISYRWRCTILLRQWDISLQEPRPTYEPLIIQSGFLFSGASFAKNYQKFRMPETTLCAMSQFRKISIKAEWRINCADQRCLLQARILGGLSQCRTHLVV
jgi:hypothetical protein